jgi:two-component system sensor histidine kinase HydH
VGLYTHDFAGARAEDVRQSVLLGGVLILLGTAGLFALLQAQKMRVAQSTIQDLESYTRDVIESLPDALVSLDSKGRIVSPNTRAETLFGVRKSDAVGRPLADLIGPMQGDLGSRLETGEAFVEQPASCVTSDGETIPVRVSAAPLTDRKSLRIGTVILLRDQREIRAME